ncbi:hypothetical protein RJ639_044352, partial [Escallonia herrerae]
SNRMMEAGNGQISVPPGFRFHPTDEELLYYYLRKKVSYEAIDLDVITEVDLNKLEPWDLKDKCRIGSGPQNEWYFFSHKDKKYPTGTRTNRATAAGFWKATGRDKTIHLSNSKRIGMRKTLVFYTGRAPHGQKTDWIMHEYRLDDDTAEVQEDGWVVCRVFTKKMQNRSFQFHEAAQDEHLTSNSSTLFEQNRVFNRYTIAVHSKLLSPESVVHPPFLSPAGTGSLNRIDVQCSQNLLRLTPNGCGGTELIQQDRFTTDWSFLDKLLASHQGLDESKCNPSSQAVDVGHSSPRFPFHCLGVYETDALKFPK